jgi:hypothetical protein
MVRHRLQDALDALYLAALDDSTVPASVVNHLCEARGELSIHGGGAA